MLSARSEEYDKLFGFELGIDDYVVKPFSPKELMARVNAVLSRNSSVEKPVEKIMKFDGLEINIPARTVTVDGEKVELTPKEYDLSVLSGREQKHRPFQRQAVFQISGGTTSSETTERSTLISRISGTILESTETIS